MIWLLKKFQHPIWNYNRNWHFIVLKTDKEMNPFTTIWCSIENIFLAATAEGLACSMRIPMNEEHEAVKKRLKVPATYMMPVFIGVGYADPNEKELEQTVPDLKKATAFRQLEMI